MLYFFLLLILALAAVIGGYYPTHFLGHFLGTMMKKMATIIFQFKTALDNYDKDIKLTFMLMGPLFPTYALY